MTDPSIDILLRSLSNSTWDQYEIHFRNWQTYCMLKNEDPFNSSTNTVSDFICNYFKSGVGHSSVNTCRSALSLALNGEDGKPIGSASLVSRIVKGVSKIRPSAPKYQYTWDPSLVLEFLTKAENLCKIKLCDLTYNLVTLLALVTAHRVQTLSSIRINNIRVLTDKIEIFITDPIKTSGPNRLQPLLVIPKFETHPKWCCYSYILEYLKRTEMFRSSSDSHFFLGLTKAHKPVGSQTLSRWIKLTLAKTGVDTTYFSAHSCRHAATSAAARNGLSIDDIRIRAGWSKTSETFAKFYNKPVIVPENFAKSVCSV